MNVDHVHTAVIHCSATKPDQDIGMNEIDYWHKANGWSGIGYHYVIRRDGTLEAGRPLNKQGAHVKGNNVNTWGVCLVGGIDDDGNPDNNFTDEQFSALGALLHGFRGMRTDLNIVGHRDFSPDLNGDGLVSKDEWVKDCPCFEVSEKLEDWGLSNVA